MRIETKNEKLRNAYVIISVFNVGAHCNKRGNIVRAAMLRGSHQLVSSNRYKDKHPTVTIRSTVLKLALTKHDA